MTKEVAEKIVRGITDKIECNTIDIDDWAEFWGFTREEYEEFIDVCSKTLDHKCVIEKIRTDIFEEILSHSGTGEEVIQAYADGLKKGLDIIDKYENEG